MQAISHLTDNYLWLLKGLFVLLFSSFTLVMALVSGEVFLPLVLLGAIGICYSLICFIAAFRFVEIRIDSSKIVVASLLRKREYTFDQVTDFESLHVSLLLKYVIRESASQAHVSCRTFRSSSSMNLVEYRIEFYDRCCLTKYFFKPFESGLEYQLREKGLFGSFRIITERTPVVGANPDADDSKHP